VTATVTATVTVVAVTDRVPANVVVLVRVSVVAEL